MPDLLLVMLRFNHECRQRKVRLRAVHQLAHGRAAFGVHLKHGTACRRRTHRILPPIAEEVSHRLGGVRRALEDVRPCNGAHRRGDCMEEGTVDHENS
jgi:hypothetical protein